MTENNGLPSGWAKVQLKDISRINYRDPSIRDLDDDLPVTFLPMAAVDAIDGRIAKPQVRPLAKVRKGYTPFKEGDVLFAKITPSMENGKAAIAEGLENGLGFGSTEFHAISLDEGILPKWIFYFIRQHGFRMEAKASFRGTAGQLRVPKQFLENYKIPVPPLPEQERIVAKIEVLFTQLKVGVAELQQAKAQLQRYRQAVLKSAVEGELTCEWREAHQSELEPAETLLARILSEHRVKWEAEGLAKLRSRGKEPKNDKWKAKYKEPAHPDTEGLPALPDGWVWASVGQVTEHRLGKMLDKAKNIGTPTPYLRNINVRWFEFDLSDIQHMRVTDDEIDNVSVRAGDLVVCEGGEPGRASVWEKEGEPFVIQKALHRVRAAEGIMPWFLAYHLAADAWISRLKEYFTGSTIMHFTGQSLHSYVFALPPTEEQELIIQKVERRLSVVDDIEKELDQALARSERLRQSILKRAFEGKLVGWEPDALPQEILYG